jgi:hypothetical protein
VLAGHTAGPGTALGDGFTVADGTVLLGGVVPTGTAVEYEGELIEDRGWRALLLVTGDAIGVLDAYAEQAADAGLPVTDRYRVGPCFDDVGSVVSCLRSARLGSLQDGRSVDLELKRTGPSGDRAPLSHLTIHYRETGEPPYPPVPPDICPRYVCRAAAPPPTPTGWPPLPGVGERYERTQDPSAGRVEPGSHLVAHPTWASGASVALFLLTGDPEEVLDRYLRQQESDDVFDARRRDDGATVLERSWHAGGGEYNASVVLRDGSPTYLFLEHYFSD